MELTRKEKYYATMRKKLNVATDEEVKAWQREQLAKSRRNSGGTGGFAFLKKNDPDKLKEISSKGGKSATNNN